MTARKKDNTGIFPFSPEYKDQVIDFIVGIQNGEFGIQITAEDQPDLSNIPELYQSGYGNFWVSVFEKKVIGTISLLDIGGRSAALRKMFVDPSFRGSDSGTAKALLTTAISWSRQQGIERIFLGTTSKFLAAHRFYEKNGFTRVDSFNLPKEFPIMAVDTIFYQISL